MICNRIAGIGWSRWGMRTVQPPSIAVLLPALALLACGGEPPETESGIAPHTCEGCSQGGPVLEPTLEVELSAVEAGTGKVQYVLSNHGSSAQRVLLRETGIAATQAFDVRLNGEPVEYTGEDVTWAAPSSEDLVRLEPGEQRAVTLDLTYKYDMKQSGSYSVRVLQLAGSTLRDPVQAEVWSAPALNAGAPEIVISVDTEHVSVPPEEVVDKASFQNPDINGVCSSAQRSSIFTDESRAFTFVDNINRKLLQLTGSNPSSTTTTLFRNNFGTTSQSDRTTIWQNFTKIRDSLALADNLYSCVGSLGDKACRDASGKVASCCTVVHPGALAVLPSKTGRKIMLCEPYFEGTTTDSRATVIVHETSHQDRSGITGQGTVDSGEFFNGVQVFFPNLHVATGYELFAPRCTSPSTCI